MVNVKLLPVSERESERERKFIKKGCFKAKRKFVGKRREKKLITKHFLGLVG